MRPQALHERFLEAIDGERGRVRSRRAVLGTGAKVAAGGALGFAFAAPAILTSSHATPRWQRRWPRISKTTSTS